MTIEESRKPGGDRPRLIKRNKVTRLQRHHAGVWDHLRCATGEGFRNCRVLRAMKYESRNQQRGKEFWDLRQNRRRLAPSQDAHELPRPCQARKWLVKISNYLLTLF